MSRRCIVFTAIVPGEEELESLAAGARRVLRGEETARSYS